MSITKEPEPVLKDLKSPYRSQKFGEFQASSIKTDPDGNFACLSAKRLNFVQPDGKLIRSLDLKDPNVR